MPAAAEATGVQLSTLRICNELGLISAPLEGRDSDGVIRDADAYEVQLVTHLLRDVGLNPGTTLLARRLLELANEHDVELGGVHATAEHLQTELSRAVAERAAYRSRLEAAVDRIVKP